MTAVFRRLIRGAFPPDLPVNAEQFARVAFCRLALLGVMAAAGSAVLSALAVGTVVL